MGVFHGLTFELVDFRSGTVGFVQMELWANEITNSLIGNEIGQVCLAKVPKSKPFGANMSC